MHRLCLSAEANAPVRQRSRARGVTWQNRRCRRDGTRAAVPATGLIVGRRTPSGASPSWRFR
ncbi:hypothetical protein OPAG_07685 [Rhodococcus opacus PD630]|nr:hypothetical protein OPAG_07685 [Rhodococcus opacus PD630]